MFVVKGGYRLSVESWENCNDNYRHAHATVKTLEMAKALNRLLQYFTDCRTESDKDVTFGNATWCETFGKYGNRVYFESTGFVRMMNEIDVETMDTISQYEFEHGPWVMEDYVSREDWQAEIIENWILQLIGTWDDGMRLRVVDNVTCAYIPGTISFDAVEL